MNYRMKEYWSKMYEMRFFIWHLVKLDLRNKFRRSKLGMLWTFVSPLCLTMIMAVVFSTVFKADIKTYAPYILSGILVWDILGSSFQAGSYAIIANQFYIRQCNHPYSLYTLKSSLVYIVTFCTAVLLPDLMGRNNDRSVHSRKIPRLSDDDTAYHAGSLVHFSGIFPGGNVPVESDSL